MRVIARQALVRRSYASLWRNVDGRVADAGLVRHDGANNREGLTLPPLVNHTPWPWFETLIRTGSRAGSPA